MNPSPPWPRRGLYLLTADEPDTRRLLARTGAALAGGVAMLQYRNKAASPELKREQASALLALCRNHGIPLIINDDWRLSAELGAEGAHLGGDDGDLRQAREALGAAAILGASCYNDITRAERAAAAGASYLAFGAFFASGSKPLAQHAALPLLSDAVRLGLPLVAIGGITPDNGRSVVLAGADLIAVIGAVFNASDPAAAVCAFQSCFDPRCHRAFDE